MPRSHLGEMLLHPGDPPRALATMGIRVAVGEQVLFASKPQCGPRQRLVGTRTGSWFRSSRGDCVGEHGQAHVGEDRRAEPPRSSGVLEQHAQVISQLGVNHSLRFGRLLVEFVESKVGVEIGFLSTGQRRSQLFRRGPAANLWEA